MTLKEKVWVKMNKPFIWSFNKKRQWGRFWGRNWFRFSKNWKGINLWLLAEVLTSYMERWWDDRVKDIEMNVPKIHPR